MPNSEIATIEPILEINPQPQPPAVQTQPAQPQPAQVQAPEPPAPDTRYLCRHIFTDGRRCGSPALRTQNFCYYHYAYRPHIQHLRHDRKAKAGFDMECLDGLDNHTSIQLCLAQVVMRIANSSLDPKRAGLLLYGLQIAGQNLRNSRTTENATLAPDIVEDSTFGHLAELEQDRIEPETLHSRLASLGKPKPFTGYDPPYEIPQDAQELFDEFEYPKRPRPSPKLP
jgi:hypothetical protein